jgi:hypothetical protein
MSKITTINKIFELQIDFLNMIDLLNINLINL